MKENNSLEIGHVKRPVSILFFEKTLTRRFFVGHVLYLMVIKNSIDAMIKVFPLKIRTAKINCISHERTITIV